MKKKLYKWLLGIAKKIIAINLVEYGTPLTPEYLSNKGWIEYEQGHWIEQNIRERDRISIQFNRHYYRVWHGYSKTFVAAESTVEWFEIYYLLIHRDNGRYQLAGY